MGRLPRYSGHSIIDYVVYRLFKKLTGTHIRCLQIILSFHLEKNK